MSVGASGRRGGTNRVTNPSLETGTPPWAAQTGAVIVRSGDVAWSGAWSAKASIPATHGAAVAINADLTGITLTGVPHLVTARARIRAAAGTVIRMLRLGIYYTGDVTPTLSHVIADTVATGGWQEIVFNPLATDPSKTILQLQFMVLNYNPVSPAFDVYVDGVDLRVDEPNCDDYIDGDQGSGYAWSGTAHASTSTRAPEIVPEVVPATDTRQAKNWINNPSAEVDTVSITSAASTVISRTSENATFGTNCIKVVAPAGAFPYCSFNTSVTPTAGSHVLNYRARVWIAPGSRVRVVGYIPYTDASTMQSAVFVDGSGRWQTVTIPTMTTDPLKNIALNPRLIFNYESTLAAVVFYVDGVELRIDEPSIDGYIDGTLGGRYRWEGTAHNSASVRDEYPLSTSYDGGTQRLILLPKKERSAIEYSQPFDVGSCRALRFDMDLEAVTSNVGMNVEFWDPAKQAWGMVYAFTQRAPGHWVYQIDPVQPFSNFVTFNAIPSSKCRVRFAGGAAQPHTGSIVATLDRSGGDFAGVQTFVVLPMQQRTAAPGTVISQPFDIKGARGVRLDLDVVAITGSLGVVVQQKRPDEPTWFDTYSLGGLSAPGHRTYHIDPRIPFLSQFNFPEEPPSKMRVRFSSGATDYTASVSCTLGA